MPTKIVDFMIKSLKTFLSPCFPFRNERLRFYRGGRERHRPRLCNDTCLHRGDRPPSKLQGLEMVTLTGSRFGDKFKVETNMGNTPKFPLRKNIFKKGIYGVGFTKNDWAIF